VVHLKITDDLNFYRNGRPSVGASDTAIFILLETHKIYRMICNDFITFTEGIATCT